MRKFFFCCAAFVGASLSSNVWADQTTISFNSGDFTLYTTAAQNVPLTGGAAAVLGDGAMLQLGYYTQGTAANPFAGTFVLMAGTGGPNTFATYGNKLSIGDDPSNGAGDGTFALALNFVTGTASGNNLPAAGQELVIRFFNNTTAANSTLFNAVNAPTWLFTAPTTPHYNANLSLNAP